MPLASARTRLAAKITPADATIGAAAATVGWIVRAHTVPMLADPPVHPGLAGSVAILVARISPASPMAPVLLLIDTALVALSIGLVTIVASRASGQKMSGLAVGLAMAFMPLAVPTLGALPSLSLLGSSIVVASAIAGLFAPAAAGLALGAACQPDLTALFAAIALAFPDSNVGGRGRGLAALLIAASGCGSALLLSSLPGETWHPWMSLVPSMTAAPLVLRQAGPALAHAGPYLLGLALLGITTGWTKLARSLWLWLLGYIVISVAAAEPSASGTAALMSAVSLAAAIGLTSLAAAASVGPAGRVAAIFFATLLPALQLQSWIERQATSAAPSYGHASLTLTRFQAALSALPADTTIVNDDVVSDVLLRASRSAHVTISSSGVDPASASGTLSVLPRTQHALTLRGFALEHVSGAPGFARVTSAGTCRGLSERWRIFSDWPSAAMSIAARGEDEAGPATVYAAFTARPQPVALDWPTTAHRGIYVDLFDLSRSDDRDRLANERRADGLSVEQFPDPAGFVARLELWRPPAAPLALSLHLGAQPSAVAAAMATRAAVKRLDLCPVFPYPVTGF